MPLRIVVAAAAGGRLIILFPDLGCGHACEQSRSGAPSERSYSRTMARLEVLEVGGGT